MARPMAPAWAAQYIGIPFVDRGRTRAGADCWGLVVMIFAERFQIGLPNYESYEGTGKEDAALIDGLMQGGLETDGWVKLERGQEREGDGILIRQFGLPMHAGVVLAPGVAIHSVHGSGSRLLRYRLPQHEHIILGFYRKAERA